MLFLSFLCIYSVISNSNAQPVSAPIKRQDTHESDSITSSVFDLQRYPSLPDSLFASNSYNINPYTTIPTLAPFGNSMQEGLPTTLYPKKWFSFESYNPTKDKKISTTLKSEFTSDNKKESTEYKFDEMVERDESPLNTAEIEGLLSVIKRRNYKQHMMFDPVFSAPSAKTLLPDNHLMDSMRYSMTVTAETLPDLDDFTTIGDLMHDIDRKSVKQPMEKASKPGRPISGSFIERNVDSGDAGFIRDDVNLDYAGVDDQGKDKHEEVPHDVFENTKPPLNEDMDISRKQEGPQAIDGHVTQLILTPSTASTYKENAKYMSSLAAILTRQNRNPKGNEGLFGFENLDTKDAPFTPETTTTTKKPSVLNFFHKFIEIRQETTTDSIYSISAAGNLTEIPIPRMKRAHFRKQHSLNPMSTTNKNDKECGCATLCIQPKKKGKRKKSKRRSLLKKFDFHRKHNKEKKKQRRQAYDYSDVGMSMLPSNYLMGTNEPGQSGNNQWQYKMPSVNDLKAQIPNISSEALSQELNQPFSSDDKIAKNYDAASPSFQPTSPAPNVGMPNANQLSPELSNYNPPDASPNMDQDVPQSEDIDQPSPMSSNKDQQSQNQYHRYDQPNHNQFPQFDQPNQNQFPQFDQPTQNQLPHPDQPSQNQFDQPSQNQYPQFDQSSQNQSPNFDRPSQNQLPHFDQPNRNQLPHFDRPNQLPHFDQPIHSDTPFFGKHKPNHASPHKQSQIPHIDIPMTTTSEFLPENMTIKRKMKSKSNLKSLSKLTKMAETTPTHKGSKTLYAMKSHKPSTTLRSWFFEHGVNMYRIEPESEPYKYGDSLPITPANSKNKNQQSTQIDNPTYTFSKMNPNHKLFAKQHRVNANKENNSVDSANLKNLDGINNIFTKNLTKIMQVVTDLNEYVSNKDSGKRITNRPQNFVTPKISRAIKHVPRHGSGQKYKLTKDMYRPTHKAIVKLYENSKFQNFKNKVNSDPDNNEKNAYYAQVTPNPFIDRKLSSVSTLHTPENFMTLRNEPYLSDGSRAKNVKDNSMNLKYNSIMNADKVEKPAAKPKSKPANVRISNHVYKFDIVFSKVHDGQGGNDEKYLYRDPGSPNFASNNVEWPYYKNDQSERDRRQSRGKRFMKKDVLKKLWPKKQVTVLEMVEFTPASSSRKQMHRTGTTLLTPVVFSGSYSRGLSDSPSTTIFLKSKLAHHVKTPDETSEAAPVTIEKPHLENKFRKPLSSTTSINNDKIYISDKQNFKSKAKAFSHKIFNESIANRDFKTDFDTIDNVEKDLRKKSFNLQNDLKLSFIQKDLKGVKLHESLKQLDNKKTQKKIVKRDAEVQQITTEGTCTNSSQIYFEHNTTEDLKSNSTTEYVSSGTDINSVNANLTVALNENTMTSQTKIIENEKIMSNITGRFNEDTNTASLYENNAVANMSNDNEERSFDILNILSPAKKTIKKSVNPHFPEPLILLQAPIVPQMPQANNLKSKINGLFIPFDQLAQMQADRTTLMLPPKQTHRDIANGLYMITHRDGKLVLNPLLDLTDPFYNRTLTTTSPNQHGANDNIVLSKEFLATIQKKLSDIYDTLSSQQYATHYAKDVQGFCRNKRSKKLFIPKSLCKASTGCYKCRANHTMCKACAATDAVISELIFEFNNLATFIKNHCNELQMFFAMNPSGGKKLKESVHKVDQLIVRFYKRAKGDDDKECNKFQTCIDKRSLSNVARILDKCTNKTDLNNSRVKLETIGTRQGSKRKIVKNVYSMDNIKVNIICDPIPVTQAHYDYDLATLDILIHSHDMEKQNKKKKKSRLYKLLHKIFHKSDRREIQKISNSTSRTVVKRSLEDQIADNVEPNIITDTGGDFWVQYLKKPNDEIKATEDYDFARQPRSPSQGYIQPMQTDSVSDTDRIAETSTKDYFKIDPITVSIDSETDPINLSTDSETDPINLSTDSETDPINLSTDSENDAIKLSTDSETDSIKVYNDYETDPISTIFTDNPLDTSADILENEELYNKQEKSIIIKHKISNKMFFDEYLASNPHLKNFKEQNDMPQGFPPNAESFDVPNKPNRVIIKSHSEPKTVSRKGLESEHFNSHSTTPNEEQADESTKPISVTQTVTTHTETHNEPSADALHNKIDSLLDKIHRVTSDLLNTSMSFENMYNISNKQPTKEPYKGTPALVVVNDYKIGKENNINKNDKESSLGNRNLSNVLDSKPVYYEVVTRKMQKPAIYATAHTLTVRHEENTHTKSTKRITTKSNEHRKHKSQMVIAKKVTANVTFIEKATTKTPAKEKVQRKWLFGLRQTGHTFSQKK